jgi:hypothetical protein
MVLLGGALGGLFLFGSTLLACRETHLQGGVKIIRRDVVLQRRKCERATTCGRGGLRRGPLSSVGSLPAKTQRIHLQPKHLAAAKPLPAEPLLRIKTVQLQIDLKLAPGLCADPPLLL